MPLDLLLPGLLAPRDAPPEMRSARLPAIEKWLARSDISREAPGSAHDWLARAYGLPPPAPVAAVTLAADSEVREGTWLRADPAHVRIEGARTSVHTGEALGIDMEEARALASALQAHFREDALEIIAPAPTRWYVRLPPGEVPDAPSLDAALASASGKHLLASRGRINWRTALTEAQMVLSAHEVNVVREAARRPAINSIVLWGGGTMPASVKRVYGAVYADDPFPRGLARLSGASLAAGLQGAGQIDAAAEPVLASNDGLWASIERGDAAAWLAASAALDRMLASSMAGWIERFGRVRLVLPSDRGTVAATVDSRARWRLLRQRRSLEAYA